MKLIRQRTLWNNEGNADKVYEIDLCETVPGKYVVNFRYGRRGGALKDGTKTAIPVALPQAEGIFEKLTEEKRKGGYRDTENYIAAREESAAPAPETATPATTNEKQAYILRCLQNATGLTPGTITEKWPLGRIIWRAGELKIAAASPFILPQLTRGNAILQYTACWSLGRCGNNLALAPLEQVYASKATAPHVKRIALAAILELRKANNTDQELLQTLFNCLPQPLQSALQQGDTDSIQAQLSQLSGDPATLDHITVTYLLSERYTAAATAVYEWLKTVKILPVIFKAVRHLFKLAEFRDDAQIFSLLALKFEKTKGLFHYNRYERNSYAFYNGSYVNHAISELKKPDSKLAWSSTTKAYFSRRVWRTMRTLGEDGDETYIRYAFGVLLHYNDGLTGNPEPTTKTDTFHSWNTSLRNYETHTVTKTFAAFAESQLLNYILYSGGDRYLLKRNRKAWQLQPGTANEEAVKREEAFPELWDQYPQALVQLLFDSNIEPVHQFAVKAIQNRAGIAGFFDTTSLKQLLLKPFAVTAKFAIGLAEKMYHPADPDEELVITLLQHPVPEARALAMKWIDEQTALFFEKTAVIQQAIINPFNDVFEAVNKWLRNSPSLSNANLLCNQVLAQILLLPEEMPLGNEAADHASQLLTSYFLPALTHLPITVPANLLKHPLAAVQLLGAIILLQHPLPPDRFPDGLLSSMIRSGHPAVRQAGITLFGRLPDTQLFDNTELIAAFCVSPYTEIRTTIQPVVEKLNAQNKTFGRVLLNDLLPYLQRPETVAGLHETLYTLFTGPLAEHLAETDENKALAFVHSRFSIPRLLGLFILRNFDKASALSMRQWIRMAGHEVLDIRLFAQELFLQHTDRVKAEATESLRILDSSWTDSRVFAFDYFRRYFTEADWTPELLVSVCDSTREDVQSFGREMITKYFKAENGELYLLQLSQHPAQQVQHFTTHYLEQFAAGKLLNIEKLEAYFITVLSSVNKAGIAKKRIFQFLQEEALKSETVAQLAAQILARQSATMAVADKAACITIMYRLQQKYPAIEMPLSVLPVEIRS